MSALPIVLSDAPPRIGGNGATALDLRDAAGYFGGTQALDLVMELAHDLRSPLASIAVLAEILESGEAGPLNDVQRRQLGLIRSAAFCLCSTASDVLELTRGSQSLLQGDASSFSIRDVFQTVRDIVSPLVEQRRVEFRTRGCEPDLRRGYPQALGRVLLNLATNALKATDTGYVELSAGAMGPTRVGFTVRDTGPGLDQAALPSLFEPFKSDGPRHRTYFSSSGLGLSICRRLVSAMGAELKVESRRKWGTRFTFVLDLPTTPAPLKTARHPAR